MAINDPVMVEVNVLLVDRDANSLLQTCKLLQVNSYKVTAVQEVTIASSMLVQAEKKFDIVMIGMNSSDLEAYKLLHEAVRMRNTVILMSDNVNPTLAKCAIEDGAFMIIKKPATRGVLIYIRQHVLKEKTRIIKQKGKFIEENLDKNIDTIEHGLNDKSATPVRRSKIWTEWTPELHERFMDAVRYLGEGRCFPREIMELMNVPGLTRMQVASHLQRCRIGWQPPEKGKPRRKGSKSSSSSGTGRSSNPKNKRHGLFPRQIRGRGPQPKERVNQSEEQLQDGNSAPSPGMKNIQGAFNSPASGNDTNNGNSGKQVAENTDVVILDQDFDITSFDFEIDTDVDAIGINNGNSGKQVAENANVVVPDQDFDITSFDFEIDTDVDVIGINNGNSGKQVAANANVVVPDQDFDITSFDFEIDTDVDAVGIKFNMQNIQGAFNSPASDNRTNNGNSGKQVAENANVVVPHQDFNITSFDVEFDTDVDAAGIEFNMQDIQEVFNSPASGKQVAEDANVVGIEFNMQDIQEAFNSPASGKQEDANVVVPHQDFDITSFDFEIDTDVDAAGIKFNMQDTDWGQINPEQVANMAIGDAEGFCAWISSF